LVAPTYCTAVRSDVAVKAGGGEAGLETDWTDTQTEQTEPPHVASYLSFTLPRDETMPPCYITDPQ